MDWAKDGFSATMSTVFILSESCPGLWPFTLQFQRDGDEVQKLFFCSSTLPSKLTLPSADSPLGSRISNGGCPRGSRYTKSSPVSLTNNGTRLGGGGPAVAQTAPRAGSPPWPLNPVPRGPESKPLLCTQAPLRTPPLSPAWPVTPRGWPGQFSDCERTEAQNNAAEAQATFAAALGAPRGSVAIKPTLGGPSHVLSRRLSGKEAG